MELNEEYNVDKTIGHGVFTNLKVENFQEWLNEQKKINKALKEKEDSKSDDEEDKKDKKDDDSEDEKDDDSEDEKDDMDESIVLAAGAGLIAGAVAGFKVAGKFSKKNVMLREFLSYLEKEGVIYGLVDRNKRATFAYNQFKLRMEYPDENGRYVITCGENKVDSGDTKSLSMEDYKKKLVNDIIKAAKG